MKYLFTLITVLLFVNLNAQNVKKATRQHWAGGICCVSGTNYNVYLDSKLSAEEIIIEQVWLKNYGLISGSISSFPREKNTLVVQFGTRTNSRADLTEEIDLYHNKDKMPEFEGSALIILKIGIKKIKIEVSGFEDLMMIAYP